MKFGVWCEVTEMTGRDHVSWLKDAWGKPVQCPTQEEAQRKADLQYMRTRYHQHARFRYSAAPYAGGAGRGASVS